MYVGKSEWWAYQCTVGTVDALFSYLSFHSFLYIPDAKSNIGDATNGSSGSSEGSLRRAM